MTRLFKSFSKLTRVFAGTAAETDSAASDCDSDHDSRVASRLNAMTKALDSTQPVRRLF
jgi:hypothetical protein